MDRNSIIGLILIAGIVIGYSYWTAPSPEEVAKLKRERDSIAALEIPKQEMASLAKPDTTTFTAYSDSTLNTDSIQNLNLKGQFGAFANAAKGSDEYFTIENDVLKLNVASKGGRVVSAEVKKYKTYDSLPLILFTEDQSKFNINFVSDGKNISTSDLYFNPLNQKLIVSGQDSGTVVFRSYLNEKQYIEFEYGIKGESYMIDYNVRLVGINDYISKNESNINLQWSVNAPNLEKSLKSQRENTTVYYKYPDEHPDYITETSDDKEEMEEDVEWIAFKYQFFSSILLSDKKFSKAKSTVETKTDEKSKDFVKEMRANMALPYSHGNVETYGMKFYFGPNEYETLKAHDNDLFRIIPLGIGIFNWVNRFFIMPIFNLLDNLNIGYGIIILLMTIMIKVVLLPLTYKAYLSTAKMKVLKPEIDELNKKHEKEDPLKKQQALMALYKKAGVSPFGGCVPMLLQFPILIAMFRFFPASIELRHQSFLWADDLSSYDSIYNLGFDIPMYGDHVSLFTLLMTVSTILYTRMNSQMTASPEMAQMKWVMYLMPVIFLGVFNNYSAGLSYYYFLANMITFGQQYLFQKFVDHDALLKKIEEHKQKPSSNRKSGFQRRLEEMAKKKGYKLPK